MNDIERAKAEVFIEQTKQGLLKVVGSRLDAIKALLMPDLGDVIDCEVPESRPPQAHSLKCWPRYFDMLWFGTKHAEVRLNDRDYQPGDYLCLREYDQSRICRPTTDADAYSGRWIVCKVSSVCDLDAVALTGHVLLSLEFGVCGNGRHTHDHPRATGIAANDRLYNALVGGEERWSERHVQAREPMVPAMRRQLHGEADRNWVRLPPNAPPATERFEPRRVPISQGDGHADEVPSFEPVRNTRGPVS